MRLRLLCVLAVLAPTVALRTSVAPASRSRSCSRVTGDDTTTAAKLLGPLRAFALAGVLASSALAAPLDAWAEAPAVADGATIAEKLAAMERQLAVLEAEKAAAEKAAAASTPAMVQAYGLESYGTDEAALKKMSDANSKLTDKSIKRVLDAGIDLAAKGANPETQQIDETNLRRAEERLTLIIDELAPNYVGGYTNRANVRVTLKDYEGAVRYYTDALRVAPLGKDAWLTKVNRGATLLALGRTDAALVDLEQVATVAIVACR